MPQPPNDKHAKLTAEAYEPGTVLAGRYRVLRALGEGGMGQVYACEHVEFGRKIAVKVLQPWLANHPVGERFRTEARAASAAGHPNIVDVFDAGTLDDGRPFIAMEFLDGLTVLDAIRTAGCLPAVAAAEIGAQVARALHAAHEAGVVHRDLKPENVMLLRRHGEQVVKVVDFGIAFESEGRRSTRAGVALGTPDYMAPEQVEGRPGTPALDIYAIGVLLFEMCSGRPPFAGQDVTEVLEAKANVPAPRLSEVQPSVPAWFSDVVGECLQRDPNERPSTALDVALRLEAEGDHAADTPTAQLSAQPRPRPTGRAFAGWTVGVATILLAGAVAWLLRPEAHTLESGLSRVRVPVLVAVAEPAPEVQVEVGVEDEPAAPPPPVEAQQPERVPELAPDPVPVVARAPQSEGRVSLRCSGVETRARQAHKKHLWQPVLEEVGKRACWTSNAERKKLEVLALKELGRFSQCASKAKGSRDPEVVEWSRICQKRADG